VAAAHFQLVLEFEDDANCRGILHQYLLGRDLMVVIYKREAYFPEGRWKDFWTGETLDAQEAWRLGLVNRVVARAELLQRVDELADRVALVPPVTAQVVKDSLNNTATMMGKEASWKYHFMAHHWMHNTATARAGVIVESRTKDSATSSVPTIGSHL